MTGRIKLTPPAKHGEDHVASVKLPGRDKVQEGDQQAGPGSPGHLVDHDIQAADRRGLTDKKETDPVDTTGATPVRLGTAGGAFRRQRISPAGKAGNFLRTNCRELPVTVARVECDSPYSNTGMATTSPASGPAMARSNNARLFLGSCFIWMNAPMVPSGLNGRGMK